MSGRVGVMGIRPLKVWSRLAALRRPRRPGPTPIPPSHWRIVRGDMVFVRSGRDAGKTGRVVTVLRKKNRLVVEGCNMVTRHFRVGESADGKGGAIPMPSPIHYSNVNLLDPTLK